jgi:hypothetical protein
MPTVTPCPRCKFSVIVPAAIPASELDAWEAWLGQNGVAVEEKLAWDRGGWSLYFRDPDQRLPEAATPGVWPRV